MVERIKQQLRMGRYKRYDRAQLADLCEQGYTAKEIAERVGAASIQYVKEVLAGMGLCPAEPPKNGELDIPKVKALSRAGWSVEKIRNEFGYQFTADQIEEAIRRQIRRQE